MGHIVALNREFSANLKSKTKFPMSRSDIFAVLKRKPFFFFQNFSLQFINFEANTLLNSTI